MTKAVSLVIAGMVWVVAGCGGGNEITPPPPPAPVEVPGIYTLQRVSYAGLPFTTYQEGTEREEILSWELRLNENATYSYVFRVRITTTGQVTVNTIRSSGTYAVDGAQVVMVDHANNNSLAAVVAEGGFMSYPYQTWLTIVIAGPNGHFELVFSRT